VRLAVALVLAACSSKQADHPPAQIIDLTTSTAELLKDFDAHAAEPRFVTIVAPS
jgi:predicted component of type VI protein secretion system